MGVCAANFLLQTAIPKGFWSEDGRDRGTATFHLDEIAVTCGYVAVGGKMSSISSPRSVTLVFVIPLVRVDATASHVLVSSIPTLPNGQRELSRASQRTWRS